MWCGQSRGFNTPAGENRRIIKGLQAAEMGRI